MYNILTNQKSIQKLQNEFRRMKRKAYVSKVLSDLLGGVSSGAPAALRAIGVVL